MQIFVTSTLDLIFAFSLIQGIGFGLIVPTSYTKFNDYFVKKRIMWMSFSQSLIGLGSMFYPVLMQKLLEWYGFRGCLMVLAAINSHAVLGMLLMQPVEWHMRVVTCEDEEMQRLDNTKAKSEKPPEEMRTPSTNTESDKNHLSVSASNLNQRKLSSVQMMDKISSRCSSITSLGNWSGPMVVSDASPEMLNIIGSRRPSTVASVKSHKTIEVAKETLSKWQAIVNFLDLTLLKKPIYVNIVLGISFALYSDIAFFTLQPLYLFELGFNKVQMISILYFPHVN